MSEVRIKDIDEQEIDTILAEDIDFEGHLTFKKPLMIKGKFKGEIKSTSALYIGEKAYVEARTEAGIISSKGRHKGDIVGHSRVELFSTAQVDGDITTPDFVVESGCKFNGYCNMGGIRKDAQQTQPPTGHPAGSSTTPAANQAAAQPSHQQKPANQQGGGPAGQGGSQQTLPLPQGGNPHPQQQKPANSHPGQGGQQK